MLRVKDLKLDENRVYAILGRMVLENHPLRLLNMLRNPPLEGSFFRGEYQQSRRIGTDQDAPPDVYGFTEYLSVQHQCISKCSLWPAARGVREQNWSVE